MFRQQLQRLAVWALGEKTVDSLLEDPNVGEPITDAFHTFYSGLWVTEGRSAMTVPTVVPRSTGDVLSEVTPKDVSSASKGREKLHRVQMV